MSQWRQVQFSYRVPEGADVDDLETRMIEALAQMAGCDCDDTTERCAAGWVGSSGPIEDEVEVSPDSQATHSDHDEASGINRLGPE